MPAIPHPFEADVLDLLAHEGAVEVETWSPGGRARRTVIWVVVADGAPHIRSVRGDVGRWYRDLVVGPHGAILAAGRRIGSRGTRVDDPAAIEACPRALAEGYRRSGSRADAPAPRARRHAAPGPGVTRDRR